MYKESLQAFETQTGTNLTFARKSSYKTRVCFVLSRDNLWARAMDVVPVLVRLLRVKSITLVLCTVSYVHG